MKEKMLRVKPDSMERVNELGFKINEIRAKQKKKPLLDSTLVHELLETALDAVQVSKDGNLYLDITADGNKDYRK